MQTFLITYILLQLLAMIVWLREMITNEPTFPYDGNRFEANWEQGGQLLLIICIVLPIIISFVVAKAIPFINLIQL